MLHKLYAVILKETKVVLRDKEALFILLVMPAVFVLIMSLALRDSFHEKAGIKFPVLIVDQDGGTAARTIVDAFEESRHFSVDSNVDSASGETELQKAVVSGKYKFGILIPEGTSEQAARHVRRQMQGLEQDSQPAEVKLFADPTLRRDVRSLVISMLNGVLKEIEGDLLVAALPTGGVASKSDAGAFRPVSDQYDKNDQAATPIPTSVQQNAPAWTLLAMFFLVIPLSVTFIKENQQGSLMRLQTMPVPKWILIAGKVAPFFIISQIQVALILLEGRYLLPLLGGDTLEMGNSIAGIALVSLAANAAAIGFGLLVAVFSRTPEQATVFGAISVLILAAIGGIMVPKLVMPPFMQELANISPLSWGLEGFLDIFIRGGGVADILPEFFQLAAFALICFTIAVLRLKRGLQPI